MIPKLQLLIFTLFMACQLSAQFVEYSYSLDHFSDYELSIENTPKSIIDSYNNIYVAAKRSNWPLSGYTLGISKSDLEGSISWFYEFDSIAFNQYGFFQMMMNPIDSSLYVGTGADNSVVIIDKDGILKDSIKFQFPNDETNAVFSGGISKNFIIQDDGTIIYWVYSSFLDPTSGQVVLSRHFYEYINDMSLNFLSKVVLVEEIFDLGYYESIYGWASTTDIDQTINGFIIKTTLEYGIAGNEMQFIIDKSFLYNDELEELESVDGKITYYESILSYSLENDDSCSTINGSNPNNSTFAVWNADDYISEPTLGVITINDSVYICEDNVGFPLENKIGYAKSLVGAIGSYGIPLPEWGGLFLGINILLWDGQTSTSDNTNLSVEVSPNPFYDQFTIINDSDKQLQYQLYTSQGREIKEGSLSEELILNIEEETAGLYFLRVTDEKSGAKIFKLVKL